MLKRQKGKNTIRNIVFGLSLSAEFFLVTSSALGAALDPINFDINANGKNIGSISINVPGSMAGVQGTFNVNDKLFKDINALEKFLGQDHLNWFQKVTSIDPDFPGLNDPLIDPPSGGLGSLWADDRPWYLDETRPPDPLPDGKTSPPTFIPPDGQTELDTQTMASALKYSDFPGGFPAGTTIDFSTFLISDFGNKTYEVLGSGFSWSIEIAEDGSTQVTALDKGEDFDNEFAQEIKNDFGWEQVKDPDSTESNKDNPTWKLREKGPVNSLITVQLTTLNEEGESELIRNEDGSIVQYSGVVQEGSDSVIFDIPGIINGKKVTNARQRTSLLDDPGTLYFSVFDDNGLMTTDSLSNWLLTNDYINTRELFMPDFFPVGDGDVYYGVNWEDLIDNEGKLFVDSFSFGDTFTIDSMGLLPELPMYTFSSTPLTYQPGEGWVGTPLTSGTELEYVAFHATSATVPEPTTTLGLLAIGTLGVGSTLKHKIKPFNFSKKKTTNC